MTSTTLYFSDLATGGSSDKIYAIQLVKKGQLYLVNFQYGRRNGTLIADTKTKSAVSKEEAEKIYIKTVREKLSKGYVGAEAGSPPTAAPAPLPSNVGRSRYPVELLTEVSEEQAEKYITDARYLMQKKADGHRRQIEKLNGNIIGYNKKGEPTSVPSEVANELAKLPHDQFFLDGELMGNAYVAFDMLELDGDKLGKLGYDIRREELEELFEDTHNHITVVPTWVTTAQKQAGLVLLKKLRAEGVAWKLRTAPYRAGRNGSHLKQKFLKSCTCKVVGLGHKGHNSAMLSLLKDGKWIEVGRASLNGKDPEIKIGSL